MEHLFTNYKTLSCILADLFGYYKLLIKPKVFFQLVFGDFPTVMSEEQDDSMEFDESVSHRATLVFIYE